jgi:hypothetical protein
MDYMRDFDMANDQATTTAAHQGTVDWSAVIAGSVVAAALAFVLLTFGSGLGLSIAAPGPDQGVPILGFAVAAGAWLLAVQLVSFMAGSYLAGRLRLPLGRASREEKDLRDGTHGLLVWALGTLVGAVLLASGLSGAAQTAVSAAGSAAENVASATSRLLPDELNAAYLSDTLLQGSDSAGLASGDGAAASANASAGSEQRAVVSRIIERAIVTGELPDVDRERLAELVASNTGLSSAAAEERVATVAENLRQLWTEATERAEAARGWGVMAAFLTAATLLVSAAASYLAATYGGRQRDEGRPIPRWHQEAPSEARAGT